MANVLKHTDGGLLTADNCAVVFIDHQPQMTFGVANIDRQFLLNLIHKRLPSGQLSSLYRAQQNLPFFT